jgi:ABC-2 type transport system permease protein
MMRQFQAFAGGFQAELVQMRRSPLFVLLTVVQAVTFLLLVSLFALTGSSAPVALISYDDGPYTQTFISILASTHNSFDLRKMDAAVAKKARRRGDIVGILTIPNGFSDAVLFRKDTTVRIDIDNVNTDMTSDVQRGLPSAIVRLAKELQLPDIRVRVEEHDLIDHDTGFIAYLIVSGLVLNAFVIAGILSATAIAREFESGTASQLTLAPCSAFIPLFGRASATAVLALVAMLAPLAVVVFGYRVVPRHLAETLMVLTLCTLLFSCVGMVLGALLKRTIPVASLIVGLSLPLYLCSGALEPERFDGNLLWVVGHFSPVYHAVALLEATFHDLQVTPESFGTNMAALIVWMAASLTCAGLLLRKQSA